MDLHNKETQKYLLPIALSLAAFLLALIGSMLNGYFGGNFGRNFFQLLLSCVLPAALLLLYSSKTAASNAKPLMIAGMVLLVLQLIGTFYTFFCGLLGFSYGLFSWIPGASTLGNLIGMIRSLTMCFSWGFYLFRHALCNLFYLFSSLLFLLSNLMFILICTEFRPIAQLNSLRQRLYQALGLPMSDYTEQGGDPAQAPVFTAPRTAQSSTASQSSTTYTQTAYTAPQPQAAPQYTGANASVELLAPKSIVACILLSIVTCGIYGLIWNYSIMKKIRLLNQDYTSPVGEFLCFIFVPFYALYWYYTRANRLSTGAASYGLMITSNGILYLILAIFGFSIVNICLMQNDLNTIALALTGQHTAPNFATQATGEFNAAYQNVTGAAAAQAANAKPQQSQQDPVEQLQKLTELRDKGAITEEEFQAKKTELLSRI